MAAAIVDLELTEGIPNVADLEPYTQAFVVLRYAGVPFGHAWLPATDGRIPAGTIREEIVARMLPEFSRRWAEVQLGHDGRSVPAVSATIAICTRERPDDLDRALAAATRDAAGRYPILVVDNCPASDATRLTVASYPGVQYVREDVPGLNAARNRALDDARTDLVAFTDDDAAPEPGWIDALLRNFDHPLVLGATGLTLPLELETDAQEWFERTSPFGRGYFRRVVDPEECSPHAAGSIGAGANMALRRNVLHLVGRFDELLDAGTPARSGGDHDMFSRILASGYRMVYDPAAVSWHRHRRTWPELRSAIEGYGTGVYATWTGRVLIDRDISVIGEALRWLARDQAPAVLRALTRRPGAPPAGLVLSELVGCVKGPVAWWRSRQRQAVTRA
jgi:cellulose synthase/poly-beta-1,6-N-acetylglucosamine synthase-like glycosyltransferase